MNSIRQTVTIINHRRCVTALIMTLIASGLRYIHNKRHEKRKKQTDVSLEDLSYLYARAYLNHDNN